MAGPTDTANPSEDDATDAFVKLLMEHRHRIYAFITKQLVNPADVEDVFQKTSVILWKKMDQFDASGSFFQWACGIAFNEVRNFLTVQRRSKLHFDVELVELLAEEAEAESQLTENRLNALRKCMTKFSDRQQEILRRCYMGTDTITEVAASLGRERGALYKQLARLKTKLMDCVQRRLAPKGVVS